jgi:rare lipoprotein A (peptidoglycan hydrolase)
VRRHLAAVASVASLATMAATAPQHHHRRPRMAHAVLIPPVVYVADPTTTPTEAPSTTTSVERTTTTIRASRGTPRTRQSPPTTVSPPVAVPDPVGRTVQASWYGPGFYGHGTACRQVMSTTLEGVAHRTLPCGTMVTLAYAGRQVTVPVVDRGPYVAGRTFDLTYATCRALAHCFTGPLGWAA